MKKQNVFLTLRGGLILLLAIISFSMLILYTVPQLSRFGLAEEEPVVFLDIIFSIIVNLLFVAEAILVIIAISVYEKNPKQSFIFSILTAVVCFLVIALLITQSALIYAHDQEHASKIPSFFFAVISLIPVSIMHIFSFVLSIFNIKAAKVNKTLNE